MASFESSPRIWRAIHHSRQIPTLIGVSIGLISFLLWLSLEAREDAHIRQQTIAQAEFLKKRINAEIESRILALVRMANHWALEGKPIKSHWERDAVLHMSHQPGYQAIEWVDPSFLVRWIVPMQGNEAAQDLNLAFEERRRIALEAARDRHDVTITRSIDLVQGGKGFLVYAPIFLGGDFRGFMLGVFRIQAFLDAVLPKEQASRYSIALLDGEEEIYARTLSGESETNWGHETEINIRDVTWHLKVWPQEGD